MQIQVNTDNHVQGSAELSRQGEIVVKNRLRPFGDRITRVEAHLSDENGRQKHGGNGKRCVMEARLAGLQPIIVSHQGSSPKQANDGTADTLKQTLKRTLDRRDGPQARTSFAGDLSPKAATG